jgi:hypothetical protein
MELAEAALRLFRTVEPIVLRLQRFRTERSNEIRLLRVHSRSKLTENLLTLPLGRNLRLHLAGL